MAHLFYDDLIEWEKLDQTMSSLALDAEDRLEIQEHLEESLHTEILIVILKHLPHGSHELFVERFHKTPHDKEHFTFLYTHGGPGVEDKIRERGQELVDTFILDLVR